MFNHTIVLISHASKVMLKILQTRLQQYMNHELPDVQAGFRKGRGTRDQIANIHWIIKKASSVQSFSRVRLVATQWTAAWQASLSITNSSSLPKFKSIESVMPSNHLILCHPLFLLPSIFSSITVCSNESVLRIRWPKCWSFSCSISPSNEHPGLISFRMDWLDLLAVQGTLKSLLQHHNSKTSILWCSAFFNSNSHIHTWLLEKT